MPLFVTIFYRVEHAVQRGQGYLLDGHLLERKPQALGNRYRRPGELPLNASRKPVDTLAGDGRTLDGAEEVDLAFYLFLTFMSILAVIATAVSCWPVR